MADLGKTLCVLGALLLLLGAGLWFGERLGLGRLPGDFLVRGKNVTFAFPLATSVVLSLLLTLAANLLFRGR